MRRIGRMHSCTHGDPFKGEELGITKGAYYEWGGKCGYQAGLKDRSLVQLLTMLRFLFFGGHPRTGLVLGINRKARCGRNTVELTLLDKLRPRDGLLDLLVIAEASAGHEGLVEAWAEVVEASRVLSAEIEQFCLGRATWLARRAHSFSNLGQSSMTCGPLYIAITCWRSAGFGGGGGGMALTFTEEVLLRSLPVIPESRLLPGSTVRILK